MLNSYHAGNRNTSVKINAVTGAILKNCPESWFERFHLDSDRAKTLLREGGHQATTTKYGPGWKAYEAVDDEKSIIVLQMMLCGDREVLAECVYRKDYGLLNPPGGAEHENIDS